LTSTKGKIPAVRSGDYVRNFRPCTKVNLSNETKIFTMKDQAYKTSFKSLSDMKGHIGKELGLTDWVDIRQDTINAFAKLTGDEQWIHVDEEKAAQHSPYKKTVAHGFLILSLASRFAFESHQVRSAGMTINYGLEKVRFPNAVPVGSKVRGRVSLSDLDILEGRAKYTLKIVFELEGQERPACVAEWLLMVYTK
jgi:acyl dehydratase